MQVRFLADADLDLRILIGVKRRQPGVDFQLAAEARLWKLPDPEVLRIAAIAGRMLVTHDRRTMPAHFERFSATQRSPGVVIVPKRVPIGVVVSDLLLLWSASEAEEWVDRLVWIPL